MLTVDQVLTPKVRAALRETRAQAYFKKAEAFAGETLPQRLGAAPAEDRRALIEAAYAQGLARGLESDADHLGYLVAIAHLGFGFESDPQFHALREAAGWVDGQALAPARLAVEIDRYRSEVEADLEDLQKPVTAFERHFIRARDDESVEACHKLMARAFPLRTSRLNAQTGPAFVASAKQGVERYNLTGADLVCHVALAVYFGHLFADDPQHGWVRKAYEEGDPATRRLQLGAGVRDYMQRFLPDAQGRAAKERL